MILWTNQARKNLESLPRDVQIRILKALRKLDEENKGDIKALTGKFEEHFRLRVGNYRVIFRFEDSVIVIVKVGHRRDVYR